MNKMEVTMESILKETAPVKDEKPTVKAVQEADAYLRQCNYGRYNTEVYRAVRDYIARALECKNRKGLFLRGARGIGKTLGMKCIALKFALPWTTVSDYYELFAKHYNNHNYVQAQIISAFDFFAVEAGEKPRSVIIDDLGSGNETLQIYGNKINVMAEVMELRHNAFLRYGVKTMVTSNLSDTEIQAHYGMRLDDRFNQDFYFETVDGSSLRK